MGITFKRGTQTEEEKTKKKEGRSIVLYGPPFSGKTSTLQFDTSVRVLLIDADKNSGVLNRAENVDTIGCDSYEEYEHIRDAVSVGQLKIDGETIPMNYDLYVFDSFTRFEELIKSWVVRIYAPKRSREIAGKFGAQTDWADLQNTEVEQFRFWQSMTRRNENPINVMWIGHDMEIDNGDYETIRSLRLQGKYAGPGVMGASDALFYQVKFTDKEKKDSAPVYGIATMDYQNAKAEARLSIEDRSKMPRFIRNPKWGEVLRNIGATNLD